MEQINFNNHRDKLTESDKQEIFELLGKRLREKNARRLKSMLNYGLQCIPHYGILNRLYKDQYGWQYCAGQSYPDEIRTVRNIIINGK